MRTLALALLLSPSAVPQQQPAAPQPGISPNPVAAPEVDPALSADIRKLLDEVGMMRLLKQQFDQIMQPTIALMKKNPNLDPAFVDETMRRAEEKLLGPQTEDMVVHTYAKFFTRDDIRQMIAYQESSVGQKARQMMPQIMAELGTEMRSYGQRVGREAAIEVLKEHPEYAKKPDASGPPAPSQAAAEAGVVGGILGAVDTPPQNTQLTGEKIDKQAAEARLIKQVPPTYPPVAKAARVQGTVEFVVQIGTDGKVENLQLVRGHPLLVPAAKEAVQQWQYKPVLLDGKPVRAITDVELNFHLDAP